MCWLCDHPNSTRDDYLSDMRDIITHYGWAIQGVERDRIRPPWAYTVGLTARGKPELAVTGLPVGRAAALLNDVAAHVAHAPVPAPGLRVQLIDGPLIEFVKVSEPSAHLKIAVEIYGPGVRALQVVHADDRGHWPWDRGYRGVRGGQPVLGERSINAGRPDTGVA